MLTSSLSQISFSADILPNLKSPMWSEFPHLKNFSSITRGMDRSSLSWQRLGFILSISMKHFFYYPHYFFTSQISIFENTSYSLLNILMFYFKKLLPCQNVPQPPDAFSRAQGVQNTLFYSNRFNNPLSLLFRLSLFSCLWGRHQTLKLQVFT